MTQMDMFDKETKTTLLASVQKSDEKAAKQLRKDYIILQAKGLKGCAYELKEDDEEIKIYFIQEV